MHQVALFCFFGASPILILIAWLVLYRLACEVLMRVHVGEVKYPYAYKVLVEDGDGWYSPAWKTFWPHNRLIADAEPSRDGTNGIYCAKSWWHWELHYWWATTCTKGGRIVMVRMLEPVDEYKLAYIANGAEIVRCR